MARGLIQEYGVEYEETFAPVPCLIPVWTLLTVAAAKQSNLDRMDVKNVFLNGDILEKIYMDSPP